VLLRDTMLSFLTIKGERRRAGARRAERHPVAQDEDKGRTRSKNGSKPGRLAGTRRRIERWARPLQAVVLVLTFVAATLTLVPASPFSVELPAEVGAIAPYNIKSEFEFTAIDEVATAERRRAAGEAVLPVFEDNVEATNRAIEAIRGAFSELRGRLLLSPRLYAAVGPASELAADYETLLLALPAPDPDPEAVPEPAPVPEAFEWLDEEGRLRTVELRLGAAAPIRDEDGFLERERVRVVDAYGLKIRPEDFRQLVDARFAPEIEKTVVEEVASLQRERGIVLSGEQLRQIASSGLVRRSVRTGEETTVRRVEQLLSLSQATELLGARIAERFPGDENLQKAILSLASLVLVPNLTFDESETASRRAKAQDAVEPVGYLVRENEMIVREGDPVTEAALVKLNELRTLKGGENFLFRFVGLALLLWLLFELSYRLYIVRYKPSLGSGAEAMLLLSTIFVVVLMVCRVLLALCSALAASYTYAPWNNLASYYYALPFVTGPMLVALVVDAHLSILFAVLFAIPAGLMVGGSLNLAIFTFLGSLAGIYGVSSYRQRSGIWRAGILVSLTNAAVVIPLAVMNGSILSSTAVLDVLCALVGGLLAAILISGLVPLFELVFNLTTDFKLIELANLDHPLLRKMIVSAPGTYQHSFIVGNLAEAAAKAVGANSLLAKVGSYYHDIGKMKNPTFFIENMIGMRNKHDKIQPSLSALIITSHVKEGVEMARKAKLGQPILDIIQQHHGTTLVTYFYNKAKAMEDASVSEVREADYRYDGPKPQSREAAIVMIADSCEAASRTLRTPTYPKVRDMVAKIVQAKVADGQFDECDLTFRDLHQIGKSVEKVLMAQYHTRIEYPGFVFEPPQAVPDTGKVRPLRS
jgi:cyclic-di-AMP phosphodiesterase PgpH